MDKQSKLQIESTCLNKKRNRSKNKNNIKKVKDETQYDYQKTI